MPAFDVTTNPTKLPPLKPGDKATIVVTATSRLPRPVTGRAMAVVVPDSFQKFVKPPAAAQKMFSQAGATQEFPFTVEIAADAKAGSCTTRFDVFDIDNKDDNFGQSSALKIEIVPAPEPVVEKKKRPWLIWVIVAAAVVVLGVVAWILIPRGHKMPDVTGKPFADAKALLDRDSIRIVRVDTLNPDTGSFKGNVVIDQSPPGGTKLNKDSNSVRLVVQQSWSIVPVLMGLTDVQAAQKVGAAGLTGSFGIACTTVHMADEGRVVFASLSPNTMVPANSGIQVNTREFRDVCRGRVLPPRDAVLTEFERARRVRGRVVVP